MASAIEFYTSSDPSSSQTSLHQPHFTRLPNATNAKHFSCQYCNTREEYSPDAYDRHMKARNHRMAMVLFEAGVWPGKGERQFVLLGDETNIDFQSPELRKRMLADGKPFWFVKKNDASVVCLVCFEMSTDCEHLMLHQNLKKHKQKFTKIKWPSAENQPRRIYYCVPCDRQIVFAVTPNQDVLWDRHKKGVSHRNGLIAYSRLNPRVRLNAMQKNIRARQDKLFETNAEIARRANEKAQRRQRIENDVVAELDTSSESGEDMSLCGEDVVEVSAPTDVLSGDTARVRTQLKRHAPEDNEQRLANPVQQLNQLLSSNLGQSVMSKLLSSMPSTSAPPVYEFPVIPPDGMYPPYVWHGLPDSNPRSINWLRECRPAMSTDAYYRRMEADNVDKHKRRIDEQMTAREFVTPTAITKYVGRLHIVAQLPGAVAVLIRALPQATKEEIRHMFKELAPVALSLARNHDEGATLLDDLLANVSASIEDREHLVRSFVHDITGENLVEVLMNERRVQLLHTMHRLNVVDANRSLVGKLTNAFQRQPLDTFEPPKHAKTMHFFEDVFRTLALDREKDILDRFASLVDPSVFVPSMIVSQLCRHAYFTMAGCLSGGAQRTRLGALFVQSVRQDDCLQQLASIDHKTFIRFFDMATDVDRQSVIAVAVLTPRSRPSIYAVLMRHPCAHFVARRLFEKADEQNRRTIGTIVEHNFYEYQNCEYAGTLARIVRRHATV